MTANAVAHNEKEDATRQLALDALCENPPVLDLDAKYSRLKYTHNRFFEPETGGGVIMTDATGYIPAKEQVENMIAAGRRLTDFRKEMYKDWQTGAESAAMEESEELIHTYSDPLDVLQTTIELNDRLKKQKTKTQQKAVEPEQKKEETPKGVETTLPEKKE